MKKQHVLQLLAKLGAERVQDGSEWVKCSCLLAPWTHSHGTDSRPSFGISIGKHSFYHCFSCQRKGPVSTLVTTLCMLKGKDDPELRQFVMENEDLSMGPYEEERDTEPLTILSPTLLQKFAPAHMGLTFVGKRHITQETIDIWNLRYDPAEARLIFPIFDARQRLVGFRGRSTLDRKDEVKYREYSELAPKKQSLKNHGIWFGMHRVPEDPRHKIVLVEGEVDAIKLSQALGQRKGIWAAMGASLTKEQISVIQALPNPIVIFFDDDQAGILARDKLWKALSKVKPGVHIVEDYCDCKDPDEIVDKGGLKQALRSMRMVG